MKDETLPKLPRALRKHVRRRKAQLRRELPAEQAKLEIQRLLRGLKR